MLRWLWPPNSPQNIIFDAFFGRPSSSGANFIMRSGEGGGPQPSRELLADFPFPHMLIAFLRGQRYGGGRDFQDRSWQPRGGYNDRGGYGGSRGGSDRRDRDREPPRGGGHSSSFVVLHLLSKGQFKGHPCFLLFFFCFRVVRCNTFTAIMERGMRCAKTLVNRKLNWGGLMGQGAQQEQTWGFDVINVEPGCTHFLKLSCKFLPGGVC